MAWYLELNRSFQAKPTAPPLQQAIDVCKSVDAIYYPFFIFPLTLSLTSVGTVIGESDVTPSSIVFKLIRISPPGAAVVKQERSVEETKRLPRKMKNFCALARIRRGS